MRLHYLELIWFKAFSELRAEASRAYLGFVWWAIEPVLYMLAFYLVFGLVLQRGGENFVPFLLVGLVVWKWFATTVQVSVNSIVSNAGLMRQAYHPKYIYPAIILAMNTVKFAVVMLLLLGFLLIYGYQLHLGWLWLPLVILVQLLLIAGLAGLIASLTPLLPDLKILVDNAIMLLMFLSGVFFDVSRVEGALGEYLRLNPMLVVIESYRDILLFARTPDLVSLMQVFIVSLLLILIAMRILTRYDRLYPRVII